MSGHEYLTFRVQTQPEDWSELGRIVYMRCERNPRDNTPFWNMKKGTEVAMDTVKLSCTLEALKSRPKDQIISQTNHETLQHQETGFRSESSRSAASVWSFRPQYPLLEARRAARALALWVLGVLTWLSVLGAGSSSLSILCLVDPIYTIYVTCSSTKIWDEDEMAARKMCGRCCCDGVQEMSNGTSCGTSQFDTRRDGRCDDCGGGNGGSGVPRKPCGTSLIIDFQN